MTFSEELRKRLIREGASLVGFANLAGISPEADMPFGISIAYALDPKVISQIASGPTSEYAALYHRANDMLNKLGEMAEEMIASKGYKAKRIPSTIKVDPNKLFTPLPHKTTATRAGLGWIGKCALLVTKPFGSAVRLASVLTDMELPVGVPIESSKCGSCASCVKACPVNAPTGKEWDVRLKREDFFKVELCYDETAKNANSPEIGAMICGMCIAACPWTKAYIAGGNFEDRR